MIRDGQITLNPWSPTLMTGGAQRAVLAQLAPVAVTLADLWCEPTRTGREELRVAWVPAGAGCREAALLLERWADRVGYTRLWLPDRVVELQQDLFNGGRAEVTCPTCALRWDDESPNFWSVVRSNAYFPACCPVCNGSLPEWELDTTGAPALSDQGGVDVKVPF